jgi:hypothetical protein
MRKPEQNILLATLPEADRRRLLAEMELVELPAERVLSRIDGAPQYAYFPLDVTVSLALIRYGTPTEIATVGYEGMVGVSLYLGEQADVGQASVVCPGSAYRIRGVNLTRQFEEMVPLKKVLLRYTQALLTQMAQVAVCNRRHSIEQQLCRWLLLVSERHRCNDVPVTQETISALLGVRREGVTEAAGRMRSIGLINYRRGLITILDRKRLERHCCDCYAVIREEFDRLLPNRGSGGRSVDEAEGWPCGEDRIA